MQNAIAKAIFIRVPGLILVFATPSEPLLKFALYSGLTVFLLTLILIGTIAYLRYRTDRLQRLQKQLLSHWEPIFIHVAEGLPIDLPPASQREKESILLSWIEFTESIRGAAHVRLRNLALQLGLDRVALEFLQHPNIRKQLAGIVGLGRMKSDAACFRLRDLVRSDNPILSLLAARSLLQIGEAQAPAIVLAEVARRDDWSLAKVASMLREVTPTELATPLTAVIRTAPPSALPRLLRLLENAQLDDTWSILEPLLRINQPAEVIASALRSCNDPRSLETVRLLTTHDQWIVRARAATILGNIGDATDRYRLQSMLGDPEWWVRYRASLALVRMPLVSRQKLERLASELKDHFAADILRQALSDSLPRPSP